MTRSRLSFRAKLLISFSAVLALIFVPLVAYVDSCRHAQRQLDAVLHLYNRKLDIGAQVELATTEMQGAQRGLMLSYAMKDPNASVVYIQLYASSGKKIDSLLSAMAPLIGAEGEKAAAAEIRENREAWGPRFQTLVRLCEAGKIDEAYQLRNENKAISAKMHAAATSLVEQQRKALDEAGTAANAAASRATWTALMLTLISLALIGAILVGVRSLLGRMCRAVAELEEGAAQVASASGQLSSSSQVVAQGASEQAASIQATSRSTTQITTMTRQNAEHSTHAAQLTMRTADLIAEANGSLDQMQVSMQEINSACEQVSRITKVVDEIAFQTNILALNAAVEAARAGETGAGFSVVADEVRNLAQRSAKAASETAGLIEASIGKSREGQNHVEAVSAAIGKVTASAREITALVERIQSASTAQAHDVESIAGAIGRMETSTQSSAAAAEETAAIGEELSAQAEALNELVHKLNAIVQ